MKAMLNKKTLMLISLLVFLILLAGCLPSKNQAPIITSTPSTLAEVDELYTYEVEATDPDGDTLAYSLDVKPSGMTINSSTGLIEWTPTAEGDYGVIVKVSDGTLDITQSFTIVVSEAEGPGWTPTPPPVNHAPIINSIPITDAVMGVDYLYDVEATDPDNDTLTYSLITNPSGMTINSSTGVIDWVPTAVGDYAVEVKVSDGKKSDTQNFTITVKTVEIAGIVVLPETMTLVTGRTETIQSVTATYEIKADFEVSILLGDCIYDSGNLAIATVSTDGVVTGVGEGTTTITVSYASEEDTIEITVVLPVHNTDTDKYFDTIQGAIVDEDTKDDHTIEVSAGTYKETIDVTLDDLTIQSLSGDPLDTIIDGGVLIDDHDDVIVSGFTITGTVYIDQIGGENSGIIMRNANGCQLSNLIITEITGTSHSTSGIYLYRSSNNTFDSITISDISGTSWSVNGVFLYWAGDGNSFTDITIDGITNPSSDAKAMTIGLLMWDGNYDSTFANIKITDLVGTSRVHGVYIKHGYSNTFESTEISSLTATGGYVWALGFDHAYDNVFDAITVSDITASGEASGIKVYRGNDCNYNSFTSTSISDLTGALSYGVHVTAGEGNSFDGGSISGAQYGIYVEGDCPSNSIHNTNIFDNTEYGAYSEVVALDATDNWWGSEFGPKHNGFPANGGDAVSDNVDYSNWSITQY